MFGFVYANGSQGENSLTENEVKELISQQYPGEITTIDLKKAQNQAFYEVDVTNEDALYKIKLHAYSGDILDIMKETIKQPKVVAEEKKKDKAEKKKPKTEAKTEVKQAQPKEKTPPKDEPAKAKEPVKKEKKTVLSSQEAGKIALTHFSGIIDDIELDEENNRLIYNVEIERGEQEAEIEIDAYTGELILIEIEED